MSRPVVSSSLATCCSVLSVFGFLILGALGTAFNANVRLLPCPRVASASLTVRTRSQVEVLMGKTSSPHDGYAVAINCWFASVHHLLADAPSKPPPRTDPLSCHTARSSTSPLQSFAHVR